jgi:hypothetical protein
MGMTLTPKKSRNQQPPALAVPLSRFTPQVGGGSTFYVKHPSAIKFMTQKHTEIPKGYFVTWSKSQDCFHYDMIKEMLFRNWDVYYGANPNPSDWIVVGFADTPKEVRALIASMKKKKKYFQKHGDLPDI